MDTKYNYSFSVWPSETFGFRRSLFSAFQLLATRIEMGFTEKEFERFRSELSHDGFTVREIERAEFVIPEMVV